VLIEVATGLNAHLWETVGRFLKGKLLVERGEFAQGLLVLRDAFEMCGRTGCSSHMKNLKALSH
jgi:hypothetical protein